MSGARRSTWLRAGAGLLLLVALTGVAAWFTVRASLPQIDGSIEVSGPDAAATIARDAAGVPTITATSRTDLAFATGFAHGQDRFFQMDLIRRQAAGELAELFGPDAVPVDERFRLHRFRALAREVMSAADPYGRTVVEHYAAGVNAGLASLDARPFEYLLLGKTPRAWRAEDTVLVLYAMFYTLNDARATKDVRRGLAHRVLPPDVYGWLYPGGTPWDAPLEGQPRHVRPYPDADTFSVRHAGADAPPSEERGRPPLDGSNNWAVSGALTANGRAIVANDMHLGLSTPNIYYQARLVQSGDTPRDVTGVTLPGTPFVVAGSNGRIAWGYTNSYGDWSDAVIVRPGSRAGTYRTPDGEREFTVHREKIAVDGGEPIDFDVRETIWGPLDETADYPDGEIAVSWTAHHPEAVNLEILALETAASADEALAIATTMGIPPQNFVVGDADGNIGWTIAGRIPVRTGYDATVPADWSDGAGWAGWRSTDEYPRIYNPADGRIWTANSRVVDGEALEIIGDGGYDLAARARQIRNALYEKDVFSPADMLAIQIDDRAIFLERWQALLLDLLDDETLAERPHLVEYRRLVAGWTPRAVPSSVGYRLVRAFRLAVRNRVFHGLTAPLRDAYAEPVETRISNQFEAPLWQLVNERPLHLLSGDYPDWDALLLAAIEENLAWFGKAWGPKLAERTWGEYNTARIRHPMSRALPAASGWLDMPAEPLAGGANMPRAQGPDFGASERFAVAPGDEANGLMHMPTGQSGHPLSPFYRAGHDAWVDGTPSPFLPGRAAHTLKLEPASGTLEGRAADIEDP